VPWWLGRELRKAERPAQQHLGFAPEGTAFTYSSLGQGNEDVRFEVESEIQFGRPL
jgi:hypothetical protein